MSAVLPGTPRPLKTSRGRSPLSLFGNPLLSMTLSKCKK